MRIGFTQNTQIFEGVRTFWIETREVSRKCERVLAQEASLMSGKLLKAGNPAFCFIVGSNPLLKQSLNA